MAGPGLAVDEDERGRLERLGRYHESMRHLAESRAQRAESEHREATRRLGETIREQATEVDRLRRRISELELEVAALRSLR